MRALLIALCLLIPTTINAAPPEKHFLPECCVRVFVNENEDNLIEAIGSGTLIAPNYVITNYHVIKDAHNDRSVTILFTDWTTLSGEIVKKSPVLDLALIKIPTQYREFAPLAPGVQMGDVIQVVGFGQGIPASGYGKVTQFLELKNGTKIYLIVKGHASRQGDSGGTMLDVEGRLKGVIFGGPKPGSDDDYSAGIRVEYVRKFVREFVK